MVPGGFAGFYCLTNNVGLLSPSECWILDRPYDMLDVRQAIYHIGLGRPYDMLVLDRPYDMLDLDFLFNVHVDAFREQQKTHTHTSTETLMFYLTSTRTAAISQVVWRQYGV